MTSNFQSIPVIDLSLAKSPSTRPKLLKEIHYALTRVGFLYITHHDVPPKVIADLKDTLPTLFALDPATKEEVALHNSPHFLGYSQVGSETTAGIQDKREQFEFATELPDVWHQGLPIYERLKGPNQVYPCSYQFHHPAPVLTTTHSGQLKARLFEQSLKATSTS